MPTHINDEYADVIINDHITELNTEAPVLVGGPVYYVREYPEGNHIRLSDLVTVNDVPFGVYRLADDDPPDDGRDGERGDAFEEVFA